jgi:O-antigen/teichoic acid export membrane protein
MTTNSQAVSESNKFIRDIIWVALFQVTNSLLSIITMPVLTKTFTTEIYGIWTQVNITVGLLVTIITLQFITAVVRFLAGEDDKANRRRYLGTMFYAILIFACLILVAGNIWASQISVLLFDKPTYVIFVRLALFWGCADTLLAFFISYLRARGKIKKLSIIQVVISILKMGLIVVLVLSGLSLQWTIVSMVGVDVIFIIYVLLIIAREDGFPVLNFGGLKTFLAFSLPQIPVGILTWIMSLSDRYFITHFLNLSETGIYASSSSLAGLIAIFYFPIGYVLFPAVSKTWEQNKKVETKAYFEYSTRLFLTLAIPAAVGLAMLSQSLLKILTTTEYLTGIGLVLLISVGQIFMGIFQINEYIVYLVKQTKWLPLIIVISSGISVGLNVMLIPSLGIIGAAISKIVAYFILAIIVTVWTHRTINYSFNFKYVGKIMVASLVMAVCLYFLKIGGILGITLDVITGIIVFAIMVLIMKGFTRQDRIFVKDTFRAILPWMH